MSSPLEKAFALNTLLACKGYDETFISQAVPVPADKVLTAGQKKLLPEVNGNNKGILNYTNLSVYYNAKRRVPFVAAYNIDGSKKATGVKRANTFRADGRIAGDCQLSQVGFYDLWKDPAFTEFEIGHMAANNEMAWGTAAQLQSYQTFHFPNSVPQAENLNTGIWKSLESYIIKEAATINNNKRICVFTGPVLQNSDPAYVKDKKFKIPLLFFKVIVFKTPTGLFSTAFVMSHEERLSEHNMFVKKKGLLLLAAKTTFFDDFPYKRVFQVNIELLEQLTGMRFKWPGITPIKVPNTKNQVVRIRKIKDSKDAKKSEETLKKGIVPLSALTESITTDDHQTAKDYKLNMILP